MFWTSVSGDLVIPDLLVSFWKFLLFGLLQNSNYTAASSPGSTWSHPDENLEVAKVKAGVTGFNILIYCIQAIKVCNYVLT